MSKNSYRHDGIDLTGHEHGRLKVIGKSDKGRSWWVCQCECGNIVELLTCRFLTYKSCGCLERENKANLGRYTKTHGMANTRLYSIWCGIKDRCTNPNTTHYARYGGRGITMCEEWKNSFESFRDWAYQNGFDDNSTGKEQSIDRIDVNGNYEPNNCKWASVKEQMRNRTDTNYIKYKGNIIPIRAFCEEHNITYDHFVARHLKRGYDAEEILRIWKFRNGEHEGYYSMHEASKHYGVCEQSIKKWIDAKKLKAEKIGSSWYIPCGQEVNRLDDRNELGQFLPNIQRPKGLYKSNVQ